MSSQPISPLIYSSSWQPLGSVESCGASCLQRNTLLKVVSWNIDFVRPGPAERAATAFEYLQRTFGERPGQLVILLQEVNRESVLQILLNRWVQENFILIGSDPPRTVCDGFSIPARYFTLVMIPIGLRPQASFRMPLPTRMERDSVFVDIPVCPSPNSDRKDVLRLCTSHLESLDHNAPRRKRQLELISKQLNEHGDASNVVAGLIGGDMNAIHDEERALPELFGLRDAWADVGPGHAEHQEYVSTGGREGHTWGYQSGKTEFPPKRFDKLLYAGCIETVPLDETPGFGRRLGRLGVGLKVESDQRWASDHYGIAIGIKVRI